MKIAIIGLGNMGSALARGVRDSLACQSEAGAKPELMGYDYNAARSASLAASLQVPVVSDLAVAIKGARAVVLCIKPQGLASLAAELQGRLADSSLVISILAGVTTEDLASVLQFTGPIVRAMPNIAATVHCAATVLSANQACGEADKQVAENIFASVGEAYWAKESLLDAVTGLSGSGPAYLCMVIESLTDGGVKMGLPRPLALQLATQTVAGAAALVKQTGLHPAILRDQVTTPGGTTIHAIHELETHGLRSMLISAVVTATEKSKRLRLKK